MENKSKNKYNKIKKCENIKKKQIPHNSNLNNLKSNKYFTINDDDNSMKKALTKYREKNNIYNNKNNQNNKSHQSNISTSDYSQIYPMKPKLHKNYSFKFDKNILNYAEPRAKVKQFHKIQPKIIDSFIVDNDNINSFFENEDNNENINTNNNNLINSNSIKKKKKDNVSINMNNIDSNNNNNIINGKKEEPLTKGLIGETKAKNKKDKNKYENKSNENKYIETEIDNQNNIKSILNINDINLEYLIMVEKLYNDLIKDIEINKMEVYQNKLSLIKDFLFIYNSESNNNLYNIIDNIISNDNNILLTNVSYNKSKSCNFKTKNPNDNNNIFLVIKEYLINQIIFYYIIILISLIKKGKNNYHSGLYNLSFYFHQNIIIFIYVLFSNFNLNQNDFNNDNILLNNYEKCKNIINENNTWLNKNNYKTYLETNNKLSKQILINLLTQIKLFFKPNPYNNKDNNLIEESINLFKSTLNVFQKRKIINILKQIKESTSIKYLLESTKLNNIISHYSDDKKLSKNDNIDENYNINNINESKPKPPFLKPISPKYKYTLVLDLDETLIHYISDNDSAYIQIRPGAEEFLKDLSKYYEIVIFTAALQTYADLVIDGIDPDGVITDRLYRQHTVSVGNANIKDLDKIGRNLKHVIIVDNFLENFSLQPNNGLNIIDFEGNEYDDELNYLKEDLIKLVKLNPDDIRCYLKDIQINMDKRAAYFQQLNEDNNNQNEFGFENDGNNNLFNEIINKDTTITDNKDKNGYCDTDGSENIEE